jgi:hypothetical protein
MRKTIATFSLCAIIASLMLATVPVYAEGLSTIAPVAEQIQLDTESLDLGQNDLKEYEKFSDGLAVELRKADGESIGEIIKEYNLNNACTVNDKVDQVIEACDSNAMKTTIDRELKETYRIDEHTTVTITPLYIAEEEFIQGSPKDEGYVPEHLTIGDKIINLFIDSAYAASVTKSTGTVYAKRSIYNRFGQMMVAVHTQCNFYYDGNKAWYKSGFDGYYTRGLFTLWGCSQWDKWKEANGTSYSATARGVFCWGLQYEGNGLIVDEAVCRVKITCSKNGIITKSYTPSL